MIKVDQTRFYNPDNNFPPGNCFQACIASILELPLDKVPDEINHWFPGKDRADTWIKHYAEIENFLKQHDMILFNIDTKRYLPMSLDECYTIITGPSPRTNKIQHAVVGKGLDIVHDPHIDRKGLAGNFRDWTIVVFIKMNPIVK